MSEAIKILIVDDQPANLLALEAILDNPEWIIIRAASGNEALALMLENDFALVILDVQMPEMDGYETAELMRGNKLTRGVPIIFVTAINMEDRHVFRGYESGAVDYQMKPFEPKIIQSKAEIFCQIKKQRNIIQDQLQEIQEKNELLQRQLEEIKTLKNILPICCSCKKIRDDKGYWQSVEGYIGKHAGIEFSHGICPECTTKLYPELE